jgi:hypothetical protein
LLAALLPAAGFGLAGIGMAKEAKPCPYYSNVMDRLLRSVGQPYPPERLIGPAEHKAGVGP